jgi:hypothetical protein
LLSGDLKVEDLDDEEIVAGRLKDASGRLSPKGANVIPRKLHEALTRELVSRMNGRFREHVDEAIDVLIDVMKYGETRDMVRYQAATYMIERVMGKIAQQTNITGEVTVWQQAIEGGEFLVDLEDPPVVTAEVLDETASTAPARARPPVRRRRVREDGV